MLVRINAPLILSITKHLLIWNTACTITTTTAHINMFMGIVNMASNRDCVPVAYNVKWTFFTKVIYVSFRMGIIRNYGSFYRQVLT